MDRDCQSYYCRPLKVLDIGVIGVYTLIMGTIMAIATSHVSRIIKKHVDPDLKDTSVGDNDDLPTRRRIAAFTVLMFDMAIVLLGCYGVRLVPRRLPRPGMLPAAKKMGYNPLLLKELAGAAALAIVYGSLMSPALPNRFKRAFG